MYPLRSHINTVYLLQYMLSESFTQQRTATIVFSAKDNQSELRRVVVPLPPFEEQQRIVATVDRLMDACDALEAQLERRQALGAELLDAVLHAAVQGDGQPAAEEAVTVG